MRFQNFVIVSYEIIINNCDYDLYSLTYPKATSCFPYFIVCLLIVYCLHLFNMHFNLGIARLRLDF